jgi:NAD(P)-dependent dehydrogenase (short-subunit alcohol dehydrogenase family)
LERIVYQPKEQTVLVVGASGATGKLLVEQLLTRGSEVRVVVRSKDGLPEALRSHRRLFVIEASLLDLSDSELKQLTDGCDAAASCLGHNMTLKGVFGPPYRLVTEATRRLTEALTATAREKPARFVLMNTAGNRNRDLQEKVTLGHRAVMSVVRLLIPPHADNEEAADFLRLDIVQNDTALEWCIVRPDTLTHDTESTAYQVFASPIRSAIFDPGRTSRLNVARLMADLITDNSTWSQWNGQMPVIYDEA